MGRRVIEYERDITVQPRSAFDEFCKGIGLFFVIVFGSFIALAMIGCIMQAGHQVSSPPPAVQQPAE